MEFIMYLNVVLNTVATVLIIIAAAIYIKKNEDVIKEFMKEKKF